MKILIINGPNLNMLGIREVSIYGTKTYEDLTNQLNSWAKELNLEIEIFQSNHEGAIVDKIQEAYYKNIDGIVINPGAYTHTSIAILDALKCVQITTIEVHLSDIKNREDFRKISYIEPFCFKSFYGLGFDGYFCALKELKNYLGGKNANNN